VIGPELPGHGQALGHAVEDYDLARAALAGQ
jgi:hypothetical protein